MQRRLLESGRKSKNPVKMQRLTHNMKKRLEWATKHTYWTVKTGKKCCFQMKVNFCSNEAQQICQDQKE